MDDDGVFFVAWTRSELEVGIFSVGKVLLETLEGVFSQPCSSTVAASNRTVLSLLVGCDADAFVIELAFLRISVGGTILKSSSPCMSMSECECMSTTGLLPEWLATVSFENPISTSFNSRTSIIYKSRLCTSSWVGRKLL